MVFYESPYKLFKTLTDFSKYFGSKREISISKELTKIYESTKRGTIEELISAKEISDIQEKKPFTKNKINEFAFLTQDLQFIHIDPIKAKQNSPFGKTIAHGFLVLSFASKFALDVLPQIKKNEIRINYGFNKVRFINPVEVDSNIRGNFILKNTEKKNELSLINTYELSIDCLLYTSDAADE